MRKDTSRISLRGVLEWDGRILSVLASVLYVIGADMQLRLALACVP